MLFRLKSILQTTCIFRLTTLRQSKHFKNDSHMTPFELSEFYRDRLLQDVLPFWLEHSVDLVHGGFFTSLNENGTVIDMDKAVWQQGRFTWLLGELYNNVEQRDQWLELAKHGARFLDQHCFDATDGRMWFHLTRDGKPIRKRRYSFSESFAAIAYGELAKATGESEYTDKAIATFSQFIKHHRSNDHPKFTGTRPLRSIGIPMITIGTVQQLRESVNLSNANELIDEAIDQIRTFHLKPDIQCVMETVSLDGELVDHFDGRLLNPGHAIEAAWFVMLEGKIRGDEALIQMGCQMLDWMWERGWDREYGGVLYFVDVDNLPVAEYWHDMKFWWPHNEAIIATLLAYQLTGNEKYQRWHTMVHDWAHQHFSDSENGEWFGYLRRDGSISTRLKGNLWKGPFHLPRMQLMCWKIASELAD